jgi:hypothetical protein
MAGTMDQVGTSQYTIADDTNQTTARTNAAAQDQQSLSMNRKRLLLTPEAQRGIYLWGARARGLHISRITSAVHLAREGLNMQRQREISGKMPKTSHTAEVKYNAELVARCPPHMRAATREIRQGKMERRYRYKLPQAAYDVLDVTDHKAWVERKGWTSLPHMRVKTLREWVAAERRRSKLSRELLRSRNEGRRVLEALDELEERERRKDEVEARRRGEMEGVLSMADNGEYTYYPASEASVASAMPRGGVAWDSVGTRNMNHVVSRGWKSASIPKRKSPLSNVTIA